MIIKKKNFAIIGFGFSGLSVLHAMLQKVKSGELQKNISITIYEPSNNFATGLVYDVTQGNYCTLINSTDYMAGINIGVSSPTSRDFYDWIQERLDELKENYKGFDLQDPKGTVPRNLYGRYLQARYKEMESFAAERGIDLRIEKKLAEISRVQDDVIYIKDKVMDFSAAFLCTGHWENKRSPELASQERFIHTPYPLSRHDEVLKGQSIAIIGTSVTACELAQHFIESKGASKVTMMSRSGRLRAVRGEFRTDYKLVHFTKDAIMELVAQNGGFITPAQVANLIKQEIESAEGRAIDWNELINPSNPVALLKDSCQLSKSGEEVKWFSATLAISRLQKLVVDHTRPEDIKTLNNYHNSIYSCYKSPMSVYQAEKVLGHIESGRLSVKSGFDFDKALKENRLLFGDKNISVTMNGVTESYDWLVSGHIENSSRVISAGYEAMVQKGILKRHSLGIERDENNRATGTNSMIYLIGPESGYRSGAINNNNEAIKSVSDVCSRHNLSVSAGLRF